MPSNSAINYWQKLTKFSPEKGLSRMKKILSLLGHPEKNLKYIHITGTNGKGSTSAFLGSILQHSGFKVGLFTSPHLHRYNERIQVNQCPISDNDFADLVGRVKKVLDKNPTIKPIIFEVILAAAFLYFSRKKCDFVVLEVGIGGRIDPTNVINGLVSVITNVGLEHAKLLGNTRAKIALEKAGIFKKNAIAITAENDQKIQNILRKEAEKVGSEFLTLPTNEIKINAQNTAEQDFDFGAYRNLKINLLGAHQVSNACLALLVAEKLKESGFAKISKKSIRTGLQTAKWPLRLEIVHQNPTILIDVGHNLHSVQTIKKTIKTLFPDFEKILILGCSSDKPYKKITRAFASLSNNIILTRAKYNGVETKEILINLENKKNIQSTQSVRQALKRAKKMADKKTLILVLGGLYLGAEAKEVVAEIF